jgi:predicted RNA-binding Zn-ribbon protein involved in translation (DUF1610 family)
MEETYVRLLCPVCGKVWEEPPGDLPEPARDFDCPDCHATRKTSEFVRTDRDLETLKRLG